MKNWCCAFFECLANPESPSSMAIIHLSFGTELGRRCSASDGRGSVLQARGRVHRELLRASASRGEGQAAVQQLRYFHERWTRFDRGGSGGESNIERVC